MSELIGNMFWTWTFESLKLAKKLRFRLPVELVWVNSKNEKNAYRISDWGNLGPVTLPRMMVPLPATVRITDAKAKELRVDVPE
jgi:hypothetical protein